MRTLNITEREIEQKMKELVTWKKSMDDKKCRT